MHVRFHSLWLNGVAASPGPNHSDNPDVLTPSSISTATVNTATTVVPSVYEGGDSWGNYYVVLCGNAAFATGHERWAGPYTYTESPSAVVYTIPSPLPAVVFFTDPGQNGPQLREPLPQPSGKPTAAPCPAAPPADLYNFPTLTFNEVGQTEWVDYWCATSPDTVTFTPGDPSIVTVSPSPLTVYSSPQPAWPPPPNHADFVAKAIGSTQIVVSDTLCPNSDTPFSVTVLPTPSPAPVPTPMIN
jgi:hypothetical protein